MLRVTYYLEVVSSWCLWAEPAWAELKERFAGEATFDWKIALMDSSGLPVSREQLDWFYNRSGTIVRSPFKLNSGWWEKEVAEYLVPNLVAEAARSMVDTGDTVRLALANAAMREGKKIHRWEDCIPIAAKVAKVDEVALLKLAQSPEIEQKARASTAEFHSFRVSQRPTYVIESDIGDKAVLSGTWKAPPLIAAIEAMLEDEAAYRAWRVHIGQAPTV